MKVTAVKTRTLQPTSYQSYVLGGNVEIDLAQDSEEVEAIAKAEGITGNRLEVALGVANLLAQRQLDTMVEEYNDLPAGVFQTKKL